MSNKGDALFEAIWRFEHLAVHRYSGSLTGEVLTVLTIMILDRAGTHPSITELAEFTGLPKSTISRYVSNQLKVGHLQEKVDPQDRRRRVLSPTDAGRKEQEWLRDQISEMAESIGHGKVDLVRSLRKFAQRH